MKVNAAKKRPTKEADRSTAHSLVEAFDGFIRQLIVPNSHGAIQALHLGPQDVRAMTWLGRREQCLMTDFAKGVGIPLSTATHLANRLVEKGVLSRERSEGDRRVVLIRLSKQGKTFESQLFQGRLSRSRSLLKKLAPGEQQQLVALMTKALAQPAAQSADHTERETR